MMLFEDIISLSPQQKKKISFPPNLTEVVFIINPCGVGFIQTQGCSAVDVPCTKDAAGKASLCPSVSPSPLQSGAGEGAGSGFPSPQHCVAALCNCPSFCAALKVIRALCDHGASDTTSL